ncbi:hypothetical protein [Salisediminibacterium beveridgei]|uniref:hypothetical protein n=1 Tax=Salisediminibacterium beveridgei TaxID=632773 RepID=UPI0008482F1A|nr:hypothetical protein [Salisediminibacterium beveridgei]
MPKTFIILLLCFIVLTACQDPSSEDVLTEGRISGSPDGMNRIILMHSDSLTGDSFSSHVNRHQMDNYSTISYFLHVSNDTIIETPAGKKITYDQVTDQSKLFSINQRAIVKATHPVAEGESVQLPRYVTFQPKFLPVIDAKRINLIPLTPSDIVEFYKPLSDNEYQLLLLTLDEEITTERFQNDLQLLRSSERITPTYYEVNEQTLQFMNSQEMFYLLNENGVALETDNITDIFHYFNIQQMPHAD